MPIMTRMRDSMPVILFGLLIAFLITIIFEWGMDYMGLSAGRTDAVGEVNGKKIGYQEFSEVLRQYSDNQKAQTGVEPDETQLKQMREQVWQSLVTQQLVSEEIARLGITVTDQELRDWVRGDNPPDDLKRNFVDSTGQFRKDLYDQFLDNPNQFIQDPQGADATYGSRWLVDYEKNLRQRRLQEKLLSVLLASVRVGEGELQRRFADQNQQYDALYALFDAALLLKDEEVTVTDADVKSYYEENLDQYKVEANRKLKYVQFMEKASATDTAEVRKSIEDAADRARKGMDFIELTYTYAEKADSGTFFRHGEMAPGLETAVFSAKVGDVIGPVLENDGFHLMKVLGERKGDKEYVHASHILFPLEGEKDSNAMKAMAQTVARDAKSGKDFAQLARQYSKDPGSGQRGGDLGWFTRGRMVKSFEDAIYRLKPGEITGPVRTQFGLHIIKLHGRDSRELKISSIALPITPSSQTKNDVFELARDFAFRAKETDFVKEAQGNGFDVKETQVQEKGGFVPGIGINESITRWAFKSGVGSVGEPFSIPNGYAVFTVVEAKDAGIRPLDELKETIRPLALRKKKIERAKEMAAELKAKLTPSDSLTKVAELNAVIKLQRTGPFTLGGTVPGVGRDMNFMGAVSGLKVGEISPPVQSLRGAYLIQLVTQAPFDSAAYGMQRETLRAQLLQEKRNKFQTDWLAKLKEDAEIEDNRDAFFR
ncbi:MAG: ppiD [Bacteroidetes bacterium]|nr:ppiD [Bacteroidota bacterium]